MLRANISLQSETMHSSNTRPTTITLYRKSTFPHEGKRLHNENKKNQAIEHLNRQYLKNGNRSKNLIDVHIEKRRRRKIDRVGTESLQQTNRFATSKTARLRIVFQWQIHSARQKRNLKTNVAKKSLSNRNNNNNWKITKTTFTSCVASFSSYR